MDGEVTLSLLRLLRTLLFLVMRFLPKLTECEEVLGRADQTWLVLVDWLDQKGKDSVSMWSRLRHIVGHTASVFEQISLNCLDIVWTTSAVLF